MTSLLSVSGLDVRAGNRPLVADIDFNLAAGEFLAIVGESGSGKSVTAMACCGLLPPELTAGGSIRFGPREVLGLSQTEWRTWRRKGIAAIFQDPMSSLNPLMKVSAQIAEAIDGSSKLDHRKSDIARELLVEVGLSETERVLNAYPNELSGGQQQRIMIAMALASNPQLLIADEPTTALDAFTQNKFICLLERLREQRGMAILMVTHDLSIVRSVADRIAVFHDGRCVEQGNAATVMSSPDHHYTRSLVRASMQRVERSSAAQDPLARCVISARDISFRYPRAGSRALQGINLTVRARECVGIVGASGSGKSTLAKVLVGAVQPESGRVEVCGMPSSGRWQSTRSNLAFARRCQYVFQDTTGSLNPSHTIGRILQDAVRLAGATDGLDRGVEALLNEVGLTPELLSRRPEEISGGQRQRVVIARALAVNPDVLVRDEPVSALDAHLQKQVVSLLVRLQQSRGMALVFIGHDLGLMSQFCDRLIVMEKGEIVEEGTATGILRRPSSPAMQELVASAFAFEPWGTSDSQQPSLAA